MNLKELEIRVNLIEDITSLSSLTNLKNLKLYQNNITDYSPLYNLTGLETLRSDASDDDLAKLKEALPQCEIQ